MSAATEIAPGLWRWTARHPDWHPGDFGAEVASYALVADDHLLLLDPLIPDGEDGVLERLDDLAGTTEHVAILLTIPYHVRSSEALRERYDGAPIWGPPRVAAKLERPDGFHALEPDAPGPAGVVAFTIGHPQRTERPLWLPSHAALAFGDTIVTTPEGELRIWDQKGLDKRRLAWYRDRFLPSLDALRDLDARRILTTHGEPVLADGAAALAGALAAPPWEHRG